VGWVSRGPLRGLTNGERVHIVVYLDDFGHVVVATYGHCWSLPVYAGLCWPLLATAGYCWATCRLTHSLTHTTRSRTACWHYTRTGT
jgi:hypothetical protein